MGSTKNRMALGTILFSERNLQIVIAEYLLHLSPKGHLKPLHIQNCHIDLNDNIVEEYHGGCFKSI